jgi:oligopeptidase B
VVLAICHVRGGGELGSAWHTSAQKLNKKRTFQDLLACASHLATAGYSSSRRMGLWGRSAGGLTLGAVLNMQPGVAAAAVLDVPFLDVLGDMSDPELPLTLKERGEWGDPLASQVRAVELGFWTP